MSDQADHQNCSWRFSTQGLTIEKYENEPSRNLSGFLFLCLASSVATYAQSSSANSGTVRGSVLDPSGAAIMGATVEIQNPVSRYDKSVQTDAQGNFEFDNIPYNNYHLSASAQRIPGRRTGRQRAFSSAGGSEDLPDDRRRD